MLAPVVPTRPAINRGDALVHASADLLASMTPAEQRVAHCVVRGLSNKEIAAELSRSETTVKNQLRSIFAKTGTDSRCRLIVLLIAGEAAWHTSVLSEENSRPSP